MSRRGFSLIEMLVVVAIIGILSALAAYSVAAVNELGRMNGAAQMVANVLRNARTRAITERCTYVVQINGERYSPVAAPPDVLRTPGTIIVWRKNNCQSAIGAYEGGLAPNLRDRQIDDYAMQEFHVSVFFPPAVLAEPAAPTNRLRRGSVSIAWQPDGTRLVWADGDGDGTSTDTAFGGPITITMRKFTEEPNPNRVVTVPLDGPAVAP